MYTITILLHAILYSYWYILSQYYCMLYYTVIDVYYHNIIACYIVQLLMYTITILLHAILYSYCPPTVVKLHTHCKQAPYKFVLGYSLIL